MFKRRLIALKTFFTSHLLRKEVLKLSVAHLYAQNGMKKSPIHTLSFKELLPIEESCHIAPFIPVDGNLSSYELIVISSLINSSKCLNLLEIGTFNGLTTLHMALNTLSEAKIHTLDLLKTDHSSYVDPEDIKYIEDKDKFKKKYTSFEQREKIIEHYGNSLFYPFSSFGALDFAFIDGGHSYHMVKNDTEKVLKALKRGGKVIWHDYTPDCPGVFSYLNELADELPLVHIEGTSFVYFTQEAYPAPS